MLLRRVITISIVAGAVIAGGVIVHSPAASAVPPARGAATAAAASAANVPDTRPDPARGPVYAYVNEVPVYSQEVAARINELSPEQYRQMTALPNGIQGFIDDYLTTRLVIERARGLGLENSDTFVRRLREAADQILLETYMQVLVKGVPQPTDAELDVYYRLHLADYTQPESLQLMYALVSDTALAEQVYRRARNGADFEALRAESSLTADSIATLSVSGLSPDIREAMLALAVGDYFPPYPTRQGIYVFRKLAVLPTRILPLNEVSDDVRRSARREKVQAFTDAYLESLKRDYPIRIVGTVQ